MDDLNEMNIMGRITTDIRGGTTENGADYVFFSVATNEYYQDKNGERQQKTTFHSITAWRKWADIVDKINLQKGDLVMIRGSLDYEEYKGTKYPKIKLASKSARLQFISRPTKKPDNDSNFEEDIIG